MALLPRDSSETLTKDQVLLSWALAEAMSPRWRAETLASVGDGLGRKLLSGEIPDLEPREKEVLITSLRTRRPYLMEQYIDKAGEFRLMDLPIEMLELLPVMPSFSWKDDPVPLGHYIDWDRNADWHDDPRNHAQAALKSPPSSAYSGYPIIAYSPQTRTDVLIEGYVRCITSLWKHRAGENIPPIRMIYAAAPQADRLKGFYKP